MVILIATDPWSIRRVTRSNIFFCCCCCRLLPKMSKFGGPVKVAYLRNMLIGPFQFLASFPRGFSSLFEGIREGNGRRERRDGSFERKLDDTAVFNQQFFFPLFFRFPFMDEFDRWSRWMGLALSNPTYKPPMASFISSIESSSQCRRPTSTTRSRTILSSDTPRSFPLSIERDWRPSWPIPRVIAFIFSLLAR